jgi:putative ABC transport system ATP-binding protein
MIHLRQTGKAFNGKRQVTSLHPIDLAIGKGEMVGIIGPSGSGKATLLHLIEGLDRPPAGEIRIDSRCWAS